MRKHWALLTGILLLTLPLLAQTGLVRLRITTSKGEAMIQAEVSLLDGKGKAEKIVRANRLGQIAFADLTPGAHRLRIEAEGFATREILVDVVKNGETKNLEIVMQPGTQK